ncbi:MAG: hypothetical protein KF901_05035 [Myxococcales bacterium]|nr:hypothetical protein [Myxococcales bacterium]
MSVARNSWWLGCVALGVVVACGGDDGPGEDGGLDEEVDAGPPDAGPGCRAEEHPTPAPGRCEARIADPEATLRVGADGDAAYIVPGARRVLRLGTQVRLPGFPMRVRAVPGSDFAIVTDGGVASEQLSVVNLSTGEVVDQRLFRRRVDEALFLGLAISSDGRRVFASGGGSNVIRVYDFDLTTGQLEDRASITLADQVSEGYVSGLALLDDDRTLIAALLFGDQIVVYDTEAGVDVRRVALPDLSYPYDVVVAPHTSAADATVFVSLWRDRAVVPVEVGAGTVGEAITVGKNPEGLAISPDGATVVVADSDSDSLSILDVAARSRVRQRFVTSDAAPRGSSPSAGAFDATGDRFFAVNAGDNAVDVFETDGWTRLGRIPTMWYPTDVQVLTDGRVLLLAGKHEGTGANTNPSRDDILDLVGGSLSIVPAEEITPENLARWDLEIASNNDRATRFHEVDCEPEAPYDFPIPRPDAGAPSPHIRHVILVVRENKTYDAYFGDLTDDEGNPYGAGEPSLVLVPESEQVIPNTRALARAFAHGDNYYSLAEQSVQGHIWTTLGRTTDFIERSWLTTWGRGYWRIPPQGIDGELGYPEEGGVFDWLVDNEISVTNFGQIVASRAAAPFGRYPGLVYNLSVRDVDRARFLEDRWLRTCQLSSFSYVLLPNDHTSGGQPGQPTPRSMIADNDHAVGILVDAISRSTFWPETVIFIIQDDPQDGGDHIDNHRSPMLVISPWVKRGYVSSVHYNESSIFRTIQLIFGVDEPLNAYWANASPMYDLFTSTPDFTPYEAIERRWPEEINPAGTGTAFEAQSLRWDFSVPDEQPGLSRALWRHFHGTDAPWAISREEILEALEGE